MALRLTLIVLVLSVFCGSTSAQRFRFRFSASQGSNRSISSTSPSVTMPNGGFGSISSGTLRPFVTGFTPIVGQQLVWPSSSFQQPRGTLPNIEPDERQQRRAEARDALRERTMQRYVRKAENELRFGRTGTARVYYRLALKRAGRRVRTTNPNQVGRTGKR